MPKDPLSDAWLLRASTAQKRRWEEASERAGYRSLAEWIRHRLDDAASAEALAEIVAGESGIEIYVPSRESDPTPYVLDRRRLADGRAGEVLAELAAKPWCTPALLYKLVRSPAFDTAVRRTSPHT